MTVLMPDASRNEPIAIVGSSCRFPGGASSPSKLWDLLQNPRDVSQEIPSSRWNLKGFHHEDSQFPGHTNVTRSYFLDDDVTKFDAPFFSLTPSEAKAMDPQQRLLLETVYEGMEGAGLTIEGLRGSDTSVYVGVMYVDYEHVQMRDFQHIPTYLAIGTARSILSNRISHFFDWHGPSLTLDTACSSSLVALHQAVQALRSGESRVAVAAGTNLLLGPEPYIYESKLNMLSPDGKSRMWDEGANGYARGDGVAAVFLKTLSAALADGDNIEAIIRETGVNQDGRTRGITMPSAMAQKSLIWDTYHRAGLDPTSQKDRCQYFEAHGTGTPTGDPIEAEAVSAAFFPRRNSVDEGSKLLVGSVKTIIGHTEGTSGLAGVLKVAQAMKHGLVPPNMLLKRLNPRVAPFYDRLQIPQKLTPWPELSPGQPRRASVNSFGFGGTNAHVILESLEASPNQTDSVQMAGRSLTPFLFSAQSKQALLGNLTEHLKYVSQNPETSSLDLAWTLHSRRSRLPLRVSLPTSSMEELRSRLQDLISNFQISPKLTGTGTRETRLLGVFTGQGAQWARMGADLIETSPYAASILDDLDSTLAKLPVDDRPSRTLREEVLAPPNESNVNKALVAQPICTAIQIILVSLLRLAGINFAAVVGHSSGEIAAAYAAGQLSAHDAIRLAYYRGIHSSLAIGPCGVEGAMLAVGTSREDANEVCNDPEFAGRVKVAASNSPSSVTLSGDADAIDEIALLFEDENKFVRRLKVDKAYHSHHMIPCAQPYLTSVRPFAVACPPSDTSCTWISSVYPDLPAGSSPSIDGQYWVDNLLSPVLFTQAVERLMAFGPFDAAIEVGPHPALKGPVQETLSTLGHDIPYTGLLHRNRTAQESISSALGYLWTQLDHIDINFEGLDRAIYGVKTPKFVSDIPTYQWNHSEGYWHESVYSQRLRLRQGRVHPLLGDLMPESSQQQLIWKTILRPQDLKWIQNHKIQGQSVFPAAGYAATALETVPSIANDYLLKSVALEDLSIHQALVFSNDEQDPGIEVRSIVNHITKEAGWIRAAFSYEASVGRDRTFELVASAKLVIEIGEPQDDAFPAVASHVPNMVEVPSNALYSWLSDVGYGYTGPFRALSDLRRKLGRASGSVAIPDTEDGERPLSLHPAVLDAAFHSIILAFSYPKDGRLWSLHLPTHVKSIRINPQLCGQRLAELDNLPFVATIDADVSDQSAGFRGDVEIQCVTGANAIIQVEGLHVVPFTPATSADDLTMFHKTEWVFDAPTADIPEMYLASAEEQKLAVILERCCLFYLGQLEGDFPANHPARANKNFAAYLEFASYHTNLCLGGNAPYARLEWLNDTLEDIKDLTKPFDDRPEVKAMYVVGEHMPRVMRGETTMLDHLMPNGLLNDYYANALGMRQGLNVMAEIVWQITRRFPNANILEIGAGTGGATREILKRTDQHFSNYCFTDISAAFFTAAESEFENHSDRMTFKILDLEKDPQLQGHEHGSFDIVIGSLVIHATKSLEQTLRRVRSLLKPGGYLIMLEVTNVDAMRATALFGCLPGWWEGIDEGRTLGAAVTPAKWDSLLRSAGFAGIDSITSPNDSLAIGSSVILSQATDEWVDFLRDPLIEGLSSREKFAISKLYIIGGRLLHISKLAGDVQKHLRGFCDEIVRVEKLEDLARANLEATATVLVLSELDEPVFKNMNAATFDAVKGLLGSGSSFLWVSQDRLTDNPFSNMPIGFVRSVSWEVPDLHYQFIDFEGAQKIDARVLAEALVRFKASGTIRDQTKRNNLWSIESEIVRTSDGRHLVRRLAPFDQANDRYNAARRSVIKSLDPGESTAMIEYDGGQYCLHESLPTSVLQQRRSTDRTVALITSFSTLKPAKTVLGDAFVLLGNSKADGSARLTLSAAATSRSECLDGVLVPCRVERGSEAMFLSLVTASLCLPTLTSRLHRGDVLVVHGANIAWASMIRWDMESKACEVIFTTDNFADAQQRKWTYINRYTTSGQLKSLLPPACTHFLDLAYFNAVGPRCSRITSRMPSNISNINPESMLSSQSDWARIQNFDEHQVRTVLSHAITTASGVLKLLDGESFCDLLQLSEVTENSTSASAFTIVEWNASTVPVSVQTTQVRFKPDRTYWLVGLAKDMGLSIASWMIKNGARFLVITSRNPQIEPAWLEAVAHEGVKIKITHNDIADMTSMQSTYDEICSTMPPLAGIHQGAMVLNDLEVADMQLSDFLKVTRPKVDGSLVIERLVKHAVLDFFIFYSSIAAVAGNPGQSNYTAANLFMTGLAQQRRKHGHAASVVELSLVLGLGYITRERGDTLTGPSFDRGFLTTSEVDVHQTLAEAVIASHPESGEVWQITNGLRLIAANNPHRPHWYAHPHAACLTTRISQVEAGVEEGNGAQSTRDRLTQAASKEEVEKIITDSFIDQLRKMQHLSDDYEINSSSSTFELGLDSLVAVRIRSWFLNQFEVNIPALKIMKDTVLQELIDQAVEEIPITLTPLLSDRNEECPDNDDSSLSSSSDLDVMALLGTPAFDSEGTTGTSLASDDLEAPETPAPIEVDDFVERAGPLSFTQSAFYFVHELLDDKSTLNNTVMLHLEGQLRVKDLAQAIMAMGHRHESIRTRIRSLDGEIVQEVLNIPTIKLEQKFVKDQKEIVLEYEDLRRHVYNLSGGETGKVSLLSKSSTDHYLLMGSHHIFFDRASTDVFLLDLERAYHGQTPGVSPLQYFDYSNQQITNRQSGLWTPAISFWRQEFATLPEPLSLRRSRISERVPLTRYECHTPEFRIDAQTSLQIRKIARQHRSTAFHFHLAALQTLLHRFLGTTDICIGIADGSRRDEHLWTGIGPFFNTLPLRLTASDGQTFEESMKEAGRKSLLVLEHSIPLEIILHELRVSRDSTHTPLAQAFMNYAESSVEDTSSLFGCHMQVARDDQAELPYDITLTVINNKTGDTRIICNVQKSLYSADDAMIIAHGYEDILREFARSPQKVIGSQWQFRRSVLDKALVAGKGPKFESTWPETLVHRFCDLSTTTSNALAVRDAHGGCLTYEELSRHADEIASTLLDASVQPGDRVAIFQPSTIYWPASVIAILKIGAIYVPLDPETPIDRLASIVSDCQPRAILTHPTTMSSITGLRPSSSTHIIDITRAPSDLALDVPILAESEAPAIILYTSGSTGVPKGVLLRHESLRYEFDHCSATYGLGPTDVVLQQSAWSFDLSVTQMFLAFGAGASLYLADNSKRADSQAITALVRREGITVTYATPTEYRTWLQYNNQELLQTSSWHLALVAGEAVTEPLLQLFRDLRRSELRLFNVYGPTETTCGSTKTELNYQVANFYEGTVPVGRASAGECFYILDEKQDLQPCGNSGEVVIGGVGVAMGYLTDGDRTRASFIPDPFIDKDFRLRGWKTMYRTGDLGCLQEDGTLILQGRINGDQEVKINGVRIDLGDVEQTIFKTAYPNLVDVVATSRESQDRQLKYLVAHVTFADDYPAVKTDDFLHNLLKDLPLPRQMRPLAILPMKTLPRTIAGKVDRKAVAALPVLRDVAQTDDGATLSEAEAMLLTLWQSVIPEELISTSRIRKDTDFFAVGGSSIILLELQHRMKTQFNVSVPLLDLFRTSTLSSMARLVVDSEAGLKPKDIDWDAETEPSASLPSFWEAKLHSRQPTPFRQNIVLTGATGFLGQCLLTMLVEREDVEHVFCIAVRGHFDDQTTRLMQISNKIKPFKGDLRLPRLGLSKDEASEIFSSAKAVIHNGADVSHLKTYSSLRAANLDSTKELAALCLRHQVPMHYISTAGVTFYNPAPAHAETTAALFAPSPDGVYGYIASKWASEVYLEKVNIQFGLPVLIHRPSSIIRPEEGMESENPAADVLQNVLTYSKRIRAVPTTPSLKGFVDFVNLDTVGQNIIARVMDSSRDTEITRTDVQYVHESGDLEINISDIRNYLEQLTARDIKEVSLNQWLALAQDDGLSAAMATAIGGLGNENEHMNFPRLLKKS